MTQDNQYLISILEKVSDTNASMMLMKSEIQHIKADISFIKDEDKEQNRLLEEHILGVRTNSQRLDNEILSREQQNEELKIQIKNLEERLSKAEFLPVFGSMLKKVLMWLAGFIGAIAAIIAWFR